MNTPNSFKAPACSHWTAQSAALFEFYAALHSKGGGDAQNRYVKYQIRKIERKWAPYQIHSVRFQFQKQLFPNNTDTQWTQLALVSSIQCTAPDTPNHQRPANVVRYSGAETDSDDDDDGWEEIVSEVEEWMNKLLELDNGPEKTNGVVPFYFSALRVFEGVTTGATHVNYTGR